MDGRGSAAPLAGRPVKHHPHQQGATSALFHESPMHAVAPTYLEPTLTAQLLPRCQACGDRHPLAYQPPQPAGTCPNCGASSSLPRAVTVPALITGGSIARIGSAFLTIGRTLARLSKRI